MDDNAVNVKGNLKKKIKKEMHRKKKKNPMMEDIVCQLLPEKDAATGGPCEEINQAELSEGEAKERRYYIESIFESL